MMTLYEEITAIIEKIAEGDADYWNGYDMFGVLDREAVIADIMAAVVEHDGEVLEVYGGG
jgi:hypothetical protein